MLQYTLLTDGFFLITDLPDFRFPFKLDSDEGVECSHDFILTVRVLSAGAVLLELFGMSQTEYRVRESEDSMTRRVEQG